MSAERGLRAALVQINTTVGDLAGNRVRTAAAYAEARRQGAGIVLFPELTLTGYPPEDLLLKPSFLEDTRATLAALCPEIRAGLALVGFVDQVGGRPFNAAAVIGEGRILDIYHKCTLPNYGVFDEKRYFAAATRCPIYALGRWRIALNICEDIWIPEGVPRVQSAAGANLMLNLSASPYHSGKGRLREALVCGLARRLRLPLLHTNLVGGQDELVFDGQSLAVAADGRLLGRAPQFTEHILLIDIPSPPPTEGRRVGAAQDPPPTSPAPASDSSTAATSPTPGIEIPDFATALTAAEVTLPSGLEAHLSLGPAGTRQPTPVDAEWPRRLADPWRPGPRISKLGEIGRSHHACADGLGPEEEDYRALMLGLRDYVRKNGFRGVVLGLSGGIDSALTATIAADALGADAVVAIAMPTEYSSESSQQGARALAGALGIELREVPIQAMFAQTLRDLRPLLRDRPPDVTEENIQARIRGVVLMAYSNKFGHLVLATGNKSEVAVGYCTLYGDMVGGYAVLKDVLKTHVYRLSRWRNARQPDAPPIPADTLSRPPSAELRPDQRDSDSLPPYETLDPIVQALVEDERHPREVVAAGYPRGLVDRVFRMIQGNEYKRRQAAPGIKITPRAFGKDRRYPLTNRYRPLGDDPAA